MVKDYSLRIRVDDRLVEAILNKAKFVGDLPRITDYLFISRGEDVKSFSPAKVCFRVRVFEDGNAEFSKIETMKTDSGYSDIKEKIASGNSSEVINTAIDQGYEEWGKISMFSQEYSYKTKSGEKVKLLVQKIDPLGKFLKIEATTLKALNETVDDFGLEGYSKIEENAAVMLAKQKGLL